MLKQRQHLNLILKGLTAMLKWFYQKLKIKIIIIRVRVDSQEMSHNTLTLICQERAEKSQCVTM